MGDGNYEAAQFLNALPDAENLNVWSDKNGVFVHTNYSREVFFSDDGGEHWTASKNEVLTCNLKDIYQVKSKYYSDNERSWQYNNGELLVSENGGETWQAAITTEALSQAESAYYHKENSSENYVRIFINEPFDVVKDTKTGNIIVAMGQEGVLVFK